jgi:lysophospholipid acyltransferase (LPLAT)-like uncharacterized protein
MKLSTPDPTVPANRRSRSSGLVVPRTLKWHQRLAARCIAAGVWAISATWRCRFHDPHGALTPERSPLIFALWHNRLALSTTIWRDWVVPHAPANGLAALVSASHDGGMLARALRCFGINAVRGSSSRRGPQALIELTTALDQGRHACITPDGPRGPRYRVAEGVIALAQLSGRPIVPISAHVRGKIVLRSWDAFQIPLPFARCEIHFGQPLLVPRETTAEQREALRAELERMLAALTRD